MIIYIDLCFLGEIEAEVALKLSEDEYRTAEKQLREDKRNLKHESKEKELSHVDYRKALKHVRISLPLLDYNKV